MRFSPRFFASVLALCLAATGAGDAIAQTLPATQPPAALLSVPTDVDQDHARILIYGLFKNELAKTAVADRQALAKRFLAEAAGTKDDPTARYVLLTESTDLAALAGDPVTAYKAAAELGRLYQVDGLELKKQALFRSSYLVATPENQEALCRLALDTAEEAAIADAFDSVVPLTNLAEGAAEKTQKVAFVLSVHPHASDLRALAADFPKIQKAQAALQADPRDPESQRLVGQFYALRKGQWSLGLPHLSRGNDETLRLLAVQELVKPADGVAQASLGDAWWNYSLALDGRMRQQVQRHACEWYRLASPNLAGLTLTRIQSRMHAAVATQPAAGTLAASPAADTPCISLVPLIDLAKDVGSGKWAVTDGALACEPGHYSCVALPYVVPDEYDLRITFLRVEGEAPITILLASHNKTFGFALDVKGEARFERVDGKIAKANPTAAPVAVSNNRKYTLTIQVRSDVLRALLDDKLVTQWKTDYKDLQRYALWKLPIEKSCGVGAHNARVIFYAIDLIETNGKGRPLR